MRSLRPLICPLMILATLALASGCSDDDPVTPEPPGPQSSLPFPDSPEQLISNFQAAYASMDPEEIGFLLGPFFRCYLQEETTLEFPDVGAYFERQEELAIHGRMFGGQSGRSAQDELVNPVSSMEWSVLSQATDWAPSVRPPDPLEGVTSASFDVRLDIHRAEDASIRVQGQLKFFISSRDSVHGGEIRPYYYLRALDDLTSEEKSAQSTEAVLYGSFKALFRTIEQTGSGTPALWQ